MYQDTLGPNGPNGPIVHGYAWHTPNTYIVRSVLGSILGSTLVSTLEFT